ncbi:MAG TPA: LysR family transcriptional regulator [Longimicrobiales bacterium]|nr:LysR family transcriptional regulator [Longimicrobiales bacterium]
MLEMRHLKLVHEIADQGGVTRASKRLFLTQSAVSHQLLELERRLGTALFHRAGKRMVPTAAGQRVLAGARTLLAELKRLEEDVQRIAQGQEAVIRLSTECYTCYHWLPPMLGEFRQRFPRVDVQIVAEVTHDPLPALLEGQIDLAIIHHDPEDDRLSAKKLWKDEMVVVVRSDHRLARRRYIEAEDLADEHLLLYSVPLNHIMFYQEVMVRAGVVPRKISHIMLTEAIMELVRAGMGVTPVARWVAEPYLADGRLTSVRVTSRGIPRQWYAATIRQDPMPVHLREFTNLIKLGPRVTEEVRSA